MIKKVVSAFLALSVVMAQTGVWAQSPMEEKLNNALAEWNKQNRGTDFEIKALDDEVKDYVKQLPENVEISFYKREIPDSTKRVFSGDQSKKISDETLPWYKEGTPEEKRQANAERIKQLDGFSFDNGYKLTYKSTFYTVLGDILMGGEENIKKANDLIVSTLAEDEGLFYRSDMKQFAFTDVQPYILWYDYGDYLTQEAKDALYRYIVRIGRKNSGFSPYKTSGESMFNCLHNQGSEGFLQGITYAEIAGDERMFKRMEDYLDRCLAHLSAYGEIGDVSSPGYGGFTYSNFVVAYNYVKDERLKAKLEILLDWYATQLDNLMHYESNSLAGPWNRAYGGQYYSSPEKQDYRTIMHLATEGKWFSPIGETNGYAWWYSNAATVEWYFPEWAETLLKQREYPYNYQARISVGADTDQLGKRIGFFTPNTNEFTEKNVYMTEDYTIGGRAAAWYNYGNSQQDSVFRATWRRNESVDDIRDASDVALMWAGYTYDHDLDINDAECVGTYASYNFPNSLGKEFALSRNNKAIIASWPGKVGDYGTSTTDKYYVLPIENWENMGCSMFITGYKEMKGMWFGDRFIQGEMTVKEAGDDEVRIKLVGEGLPARLKGNDKVYLEDFNTYVCLTPLNTTDLGREYDLAFIDFGRQLADREYLGSNNVRLNTNVSNHDTMLITAYNYYGEETTHTLEERSSQRNGFIVEMGDNKEYASIADFKAKMNETSFESYNSGDIWTIKYQSGGDTLEMNLNTQDMILEESYTNDEPLAKIPYKWDSNWYKTSKSEIDPDTKITYYKWDKMDFWDFLDYEPFKDSVITKTNTMLHSTKKSFSLNDDITVENPSGTSCMIIHEPVNNEYIFFNFANKTASFKIKTPDGTVDIKNMNIGRVIYRPNSDEKIETMTVPRMTLQETSVKVTGGDK